MDSGPPRLDDRSVGWLRYLFRKATTPDSWDREGEPHEHWDDTSDPPMLCWHRFDLIDSTYAVALMADITPAWREVYARILDELIFRHTGWWAAEDWLTQHRLSPWTSRGICRQGRCWCLWCWCGRCRCGWCRWSRARCRRRRSCHGAAGAAKP